METLKAAPWWALAIVLALVVLAAVGEHLAPYGPNDQALRDRLMPPVWESRGTWAHPLGTDSLGRDILSRVIHGSRVTLLVALVSLLFGGLLGTTIGLTSGYFGGRVDAVLMRLADSTLAFPIILFALLLVVTLGPSTTSVVVSIGLVLWARFARVIRSEALALKERDFVLLARVAGCSHARIMLRHIFPNVVNTLIVLLTLQVGWVIIMVASLSFLGAGIPPPTPVWGTMVAEGREYIVRAWWVSVIPGLAIVATVLGFNRLGDWLRDVFDPKLRQI